MKTLILLLTIFLLATAPFIYAQSQNEDQHKNDSIKELTTLRLTPEMFYDQLSFPDFTTNKRYEFQLTEAKKSQAILFVGSEIIRKKFDLDLFIPAPFPLTVTEYNNAVRRQMFDAEPTSQQRRSPGLFRFN